LIHHRINNLLYIILKLNQPLFLPGMALPVRPKDPQRSKIRPDES